MRTGGGRTPLRSLDTLDLKQNEQRLIRHALERFDGNRRRAAEALNISPVTLWRKMKEYSLGQEGNTDATSRSRRG